jgi:hypothetical protein
MSSRLHLHLPRGLFPSIRRPPVGVIRVWPAHHPSLITFQITQKTPVMQFKVHTRPERLINSWNRVIESRSRYGRISTAFLCTALRWADCSSLCVYFSYRMCKICFKLGIILDVHENITHYEPHTPLGPFLTSSLPPPGTFAQCYALRHPQHTPYSITQLHS